MFARSVITAERIFPDDAGIVFAARREQVAVPSTFPESTVSLVFIESSGARRAGSTEIKKDAILENYGTIDRDARG